MNKLFFFTISSGFVLLFLIFPFSFSYSQSANAGSDQEICGSSTTMDANIPTWPGYSGIWTINSGACTISNPTYAKTTVTGLVIGITELRWTVSNGTLSFSDEIIITNNTTTPANVSPTDEVCSSNYTLIGNVFLSSETGLWTKISGLGTILNHTNYTSDVSDLGIGDNIFEWKISRGICFSKDSITVTNNYIKATAQNDTTICFDNLLITATNPSPGTGVWTVIASAGTPQIETPSNFSSNVSSIAPGTNSFMWSVYKGICSDYDIVIITSDKPTTASAGADFPVCNSSTILYGNNPVQGTGLWSVTSGTGNFVNANNYNTTVSSLTPGNNVLMWTITKNLCSTSDEVSVFYNYIYVYAGIDSTICDYSYDLQGNIPVNGSGLWSVISGAATINFPSNYNSSVSSLLQGLNTFAWTITYSGCSNVDYVSITNSSPSGSDAGLTQEICGFSTTISAVLPEIGTGYWSVVSGTGTFQNSLSNQTDVTNIGLNQNIYRWNILQGTCSKYDDVTVTNNFVTAYAGTYQTICGTSTILNADIPASGATGLWSLNAGSGTFVTQTYNTSVTGITFPVNKYKWTISKGICFASDEVIITNNYTPASGGVLGVTAICEDFAQIWGNSPPSGGTGFWTLVSGSGTFDNSTSTNTYARNLAVGINNLKWTINKSGCISSYSFDITRKTVFSDAGPDQTTCGPTATLSGNAQIAGVICSWSLLSGGGTISSPTNYTTAVSGLFPGINTFRWSVSGDGCVDSDDVNIVDYEFTVSAGITQHVCTTSANLTGTNPTPGTGIWSVQSGYAVFSTLTNYATTVSQMPSNSLNTFRWTVTKNGCTFYKDVKIYMDMVIANAGPNQTVCDNTATLLANQPTAGTGLWTLLGGGGTISSPTSYSTTISNLALGPNTLSWTTTNAPCISSDDIIIYNNFVNVTAGADIQTCYNYTTMVADEPDLGGYGIWSVESGTATFANSSLNSTQVTNLTRGDNVLKWTVFQNGCSNNGSLVTVTNKSFDAYAGPDQTLDYFVTATSFEAILPPTGTGIWFINAGSGDVEDRYSPTSVVDSMPTGNQEFRWEVDFNGCKAYDLVNIYVFNFIPNAGSDKTVCDIDTKLSAMNQSGDPQYWEVIAGQGTFDNINDAGTYVRNIGEGLNTYRWHVTINGAHAYDDVNIYRAFSNAGEDDNICENFSTLSGNIPVYNWTGEWTELGGDGLFDNNTLYQTNVTELSNGQNTFRWTINAVDCVVSDDVSIFKNSVLADAGTDQYVTMPFSQMNAILPENSTGTWSLLSGTGIIEEINNPFSNLTALGIDENVFRWTIEHLGCFSFDDVIIRYGYSDVSDIDENSGISVFPNPSNGKFFINFKERNDLIKLEIYDFVGRNILKEIYFNTDKIEIKNQKTGNYFIKISINDKIYFSKMIIKN